MKVTVKFRDYSDVQIDTENSILMELRNYFSFDVEGARFQAKYKYGGWDGKIRLLTNEGLLPIGLVPHLIRYCKSNDLDIEVGEQIDSVPEMTQDEFDSWINGKQIYDGDRLIQPHWYQASSVFEAINRNRVTLNLPTSAGKSLIACLLSLWYLEHFEGKVLIVVPTTALVSQMIDDFDNYRLIPRGACHGIMAGSNKYTERPIVVSTWQSACKMSSDWFSQFGMLIVDECHLATAKELGGIIKGMGHCRFKIGMSGSLRDGKANILNYVGMFGDPFKPVSIKELIDDGKISKVKINSIFLRYPHQDVVLCDKMEYAKEIDHITTHTKRNAWVCRLAMKLATGNENVLVLFRHKKHGRLMFEAIKRKYDPEKVIFIDGDTKVKDRVNLRSEVENGDGIIIVASYGVLSTGVSIKKLHHAIFAHPIKSKITVLQSLGRILRLHGSKAFATLWDIIDDLCVETTRKTAKNKYARKNHAYKHGLDRIERYNSEQLVYSTREVRLE